MNRTNVKNALLGAAIALVAAYLFPVALLFVLDGPNGLTLISSTLILRILFYTSWMVIPLGAALGMLIPRIAAGKTRWTAALHGAGYGAAGGFALLIGLTSIVRFRFMPDVIWLAVMVYCAVWVGAYAFIRAKAPVARR